MGSCKQTDPCCMRLFASRPGLSSCSYSSCAWRSTRPNRSTSQSWWYHSEQSCARCVSRSSPLPDYQRMVKAPKT
jgi:hypothetical protein